MSKTLTPDPSRHDLVEPSKRRKRGPSKVPSKLVPPVPVPPDVTAVKTHYQLGREVFEEERPNEDFGHLTADQQAPYIQRGLDLHNKS